jgi:hypothetical protein
MLVGLFGVLCGCLGSEEVLLELADPPVRRQTFERGADNNWRSATSPLSDPLQVHRARLWT